MSVSLVPADSVFGIIAVLALVGALAIWLEHKGIGRRISSVVMGILGGMLCSNLGILPFSSPVYDFIWSQALPFGLVLLLLHADLRRIFRETGRLMLAFSIGAFGTVLGALATYALFSSVPHAAELTGTFAASYIGGSINFLATSQALGLDAFPSIQAGAMAADNLVMAAYFALLFSLPEMPFLQRLYARRALARETTPRGEHPAVVEAEGSLRAFDVLTTLGVAAAICFVGDWVAGFTAFAGAGILWTSALAVAVATFASRPIASIRGIQSLGLGLMQIFFVVIGAAASVPAVIEIGPVVVLFLSVLIAVHLVFLLIGGWIARLDLREIAVASNTNCGGPTTAAAMALSKRWDELVIPVILCGVFGYAIANFIGIGLGNWLRG
ncbi:protein of unknown function DUF819 [Thiorhodococcus drewsii AZ1]|uniref:DUF819 family protein n=1 Tax=Thiorhodococcus drewsii AZ1 TaxID=765913 RepID=G2E7Q3_9GAMM|nr:DUF819 family protein [Thiorhodococcus drewsii]EGV27892.1 protein of unknown function DUF819 [Thiorhodococcus drewsii AZ1]